MQNQITYKPNTPKKTVDPGLNFIFDNMVINAWTTITIDDPANNWITYIHTYCGTNYSFKEWNTAADGTGTSYDPGDEVSGDVTLYAIWEPLEVKPETMDLRDNDLLYKINLLTDAERAKIAAALTQHQDISGKADNGAIADEYDATTVYSEGDRCTKAGKYYSRKSWGADTPAAETWDATHWDEICVDDLITAEAGARATADTALNQNLDLLRDEIGKVVNGNTSALNISAGDFVIVKNSTITSVTDGLYTANNAVSAGTALVAADLTAQPTGAANVLNSNIATINTWKSSYVKIVRKDTGSLAQNANTGWIAWENDDKYCCAFVKEGTYSSAGFAVNTDFLNRKYRIINTYAGSQNLTYDEVHFK